jgi:putative flippase GtrA
MHRGWVGDERRRVVRFIVVGCTAAAVHWTVVIVLVESTGWPPLAVNVLGWLVALVVSFSGHHRYTFRGHGASQARSLMRFATISGAGFVINEAAYAALLRWSGWAYSVSLAAVLVVVAVFTYWLSRNWVFLRNATHA